MADSPLHARAENICELCGSADGLAPFPVPPHSDEDPDHAVLVCGVCRSGLGGGEVPDSHWFCLRDSAWSQVPAVQVVAFRLLGGLGEAWASELRDQMYLEEPVRAWAEQGAAGEDDEPTLDSNGNVLVDGDSVTLIKDLDVKGTSFVAKRGTLVRNIRLTGDPRNIEGRVNKVALVLKTEFLKKA